jgi:SAM-dependent methyltransferase
VTAQVKSRKRVQDVGEVFTNEREVNAMLDMVKQETERIDSRFLEPACGNGNFLAEVLRRKLAVVATRYKRSPSEYMRYAFVAVASAYGVDIMADNVAECRERLYCIVEREAKRAIRKAVEPRFLDSVRYVLAQNILCGDALTLRDAAGKPITFAEWSVVTGDKVKRRDYRLSELMEGGERQVSLFGEDNEKIEWEYDEETKAYIPSAVAEYAPVNWWEVVNDE